MRSFKYIFLFQFLLPGLKTIAQESDLEKLLWAYDMMYFNRVGPDLKGHYTDSAKCKVVLGKTIHLFGEIKNKESLNQKYPFAYASAMAEYYALKASTLFLTQPVVKNKEILLAIDSLMVSLIRSYKTFSLNEMEGINDTIEIGSGNLINDRATLYDFYSNTSSGLYFETIGKRTQNITGNEYYDNDLNYLMDMIDILIDYRYREKKGEGVSGLRELNMLKKISPNVANMIQIEKSFPELYKKYYSGYIKLKFDLMMEGKIGASAIEKIELISTLLKYGTPTDENMEYYKVQVRNSKITNKPIWPDEFKTNAEKKLLLNLAGARVHNLDRYSCLIKTDSLKIISNQFLVDTMLKVYSAMITGNSDEYYNVEGLYAHRYIYDINDMDTDSSVVFNMNTIEKVYCYSKFIYLAKSKYYDSVQYYFIKYLLIDLNQKGINKDSLQTEVKNFKELFIQTTGISIDSINYDTTLWGSLWHEQFDLKEAMDADGDGVPDYRDKKGNSASKSPAFPWPVPRPTASIKTEKFNSKNLRTFGDATKKIKTTLSKQGYGEWRYYSVPGGFAMVAPMEQIVEQGKPANTPPRWDTRVSLSNDFSWGGYFKALFFGDRGNYRVMVFIITDQDLAVSKKYLSLAGMNSLMTKGGLDLTNSEKKLKYSEEHNCYILIYEFEKKNDGEPANFKPKGYTAQQHLQNTKLWKSFF